jgi:hypothetical protein
VGDPNACFLVSVSPNLTQSITDEATTLIASIAAASNCDFVVVPCCFVDKDGTSIPTPRDAGTFTNFVDIISRDARHLGFSVESRTLDLGGTGKLMIINGRRSAKLVT